MSDDSPSARPATALTLDDYARLARPRLDPAVWDFVAGGAGEERTLAANLAAFDRIRLRPRVLARAGRPDTAVKLLGRTWSAPFGVAPVAYHTLAAPEGELATVRAAGAAGLPVVVSTFAGRTFEELAGAADAPLWLQVYCFRDRSMTRELIERAERAGFEALVLTVDAPHLGRRLRDVRNEFRLPPGIRPANVAGSGFDSPSEHSRTELDDDLDWSVLEWLRSVSSLPLLVKGVMTAEDAVCAREAGADGIVVSNHGGRQLDGVPATLEVLPEIAAAAAGQCPVLLDGGVRRGADVLAALAAGADAVLVGRPVLYGLAVAGQDGAAGVLDIVRDELTDAMRLTGTRSVADIGPALVDLGTGTPLPARSTGAVFRLSRPASVAGTACGPVAAGRLPGGPLRKEELHGSVSDPLLDAMNFLNEIADRYPDAISFAPGRPFEGFFDTEQVFTHIRRYLDHLAEQGSSPDQIRNSLYQYGPAAGQIRELIAASLLTDEGIDVSAESIVVTVGAQEAMLLVLRALFAGPDDVLLVSSPCYVGITGAARLLDIPVTEVPEREDGLSCADLDAAVQAELALGRRPRAFYLVPDHSNPSGNTLRREARSELLELASRHDILIIEDSPYRMVSPGEQLPTLKSLDQDRRVVHLGSYAKTVFPGARVGFAVADQQVLDTAGNTGLLAAELAKIKSMVTVNTPPLSQAAVAGMLLASGGRISELNTGPAAHYGEGLDATLRELERRFPAEARERLGIRWNKPSGGFFLTVHVPFAADNAALARSAQEFGVLWTPMAYFYPDGGGGRTLRLSFSYLAPPDIEDGIARLARFVEAEAARPHPVSALEQGPAETGSR